MLYIPFFYGLQTQLDAAEIIVSVQLIQSPVKTDIELFLAISNLLVSLAPPKSEALVKLLSWSLPKANDLRFRWTGGPS